MSDDAENNLELLKAALSAGVVSVDTMPERKARERRARLKDDGRTNRAAAAYRELNVKIPPETKAQLTTVCRCHGMLIRECARMPRMGLQQVR